MSLRPRIRTVFDVAAAQLCTGCGACAYVDPQAIEMVDALEHGRRPWQIGEHREPRAREALQVCPGVGLAHRGAPEPAEIRELRAGWGPVLEVFEGYAADPELRFEGSSGGAASALALHALERGGMHGLLHVAPRADAPYLAESVLSTTRAEILAATGSRYAPASPCDGLGRVERAPAPCVFIGKPCDVAAAQRAAELRPALRARLGLSIAIFCAGAPSTRGTLEFMRQLGVDDLASVREVRYRGRGWPGRFAVRVVDGRGERVLDASYAQSWGVLQRHRQWRCYVCADHTGEFADVAVGDPWYREIPPGEPGRSLVLVRNERGRAAVAAARRDGYLVLEPASPGIVRASQLELLKTRGALFGRLWALWLTGAATPRFRGMPAFRFWLRELSVREKLQSFYGTWKRVLRRRLLLRQSYAPYTPESK